MKNQTRELRTTGIKLTITGMTLSIVGIIGMVLKPNIWNLLLVFAGTVMVINSYWSFIRKTPPLEETEGATPAKKDQ